MPRTARQQGHPDRAGRDLARAVAGPRRSRSAAAGPDKLPGRERRASRPGRRSGATRTEAQGRLAKRRLIFLALVLLASTLGVQVASEVSPGRTFAVSSNSMEPEISRGDLVVAAVGEPKVGDVVVYAAAPGGYQTHRVVRTVEDGGETRYVTRGDANDGDDTFLVERGDIVGVVEQSVPLAGYAWLVPLAWKAALFCVLLASYLGVTAWDARARPGRAASAAVLLVLLLPGAFAGVVVGYPDAGQGHGVLASPLPLGAGDEGTATVSGDLNSATAAAVHVLWKEVALLGGATTHTFTDTAYATRERSIATLDMAVYDPDPTLYLEAVVKAPAGETVFLRLWDRTAGAPVAGSELSTTSTSFSLVRSAGFTLPGASEYQYQFQTTGGTGEVRQVKVAVRQEFTPGDAETQVKIASERTTGANAYFRPGGAATWRYDASAMDGVDGVFFEAVGQQRDPSQTARVRLWDETAGSQVHVLQFPGTAGMTRQRSGDLSGSLVDGREYHIQIACGITCVFSSFDLHVARMVVQQSSFTKTVSYVDLTGLDSTGSTTYVGLGHEGRHDGAAAWDDDAAYFEVTLRVRGGASLNGNDAYARLHNLGAAVADSEVSLHAPELKTVTDRLRSPAIQLRGDSTYQAHVREDDGVGTELAAAWILFHQQIGETVDHVLQTSVQTPVDTCMWRFSLADVSGSGHTRMERAHVDWRVGTAGTVQETPLPFGRQFSSAVWTGTHVFVFGGTDGTRTDQIVRYDPATDTIATMAATLPSARAETSAVWDGTHAYVFGGLANSGHLDQIVRYDPATDSVETMAGTLATARRLTSAVWDGTHAYVFGGITLGGNTDQILRYEPATDSVTTMAATLPTPRYGTSAVWDGTYAYVFGGSDGGFHDDIVRFDPATGKTKLLAAALPTARYYTSAVWVGTYAYIFGGFDTDYMDRIDRFDPQTGRVTTMADTLPTPRYGTAAVWDGAAAHVIGGLETGFVDSDDVVGFHAPVQMLGLGGIALPGGRSSASAVWDGGHAYLFGGLDADGARVATIVQYDPALRRVETMAATLPGGREATSAVWDGTHAYIFGGRADGGLLDEILRYDPATDTLTTMAATLPTAREATAAVWDGTHAYIIGGQDASSKLAEVLRYDPATDSITTMTGALATPRELHAAFFDGTHAYVAGGLGDAGALADIERYDPGSDAFTTMAATLPTGRHGMAVAWDGTHAHLYGGFDGSRLDDILRYRPSNDAISTLAQTVPTSHDLASAVWDGSHAYVLGGETDLQRLDSIVRHDPAGAVDDVAHLLRESGQALTVRPGQVLQSIMDTRPGEPGATTFTTSVLGRCVGHGIHTQQAVTYRFD